MKPVWCPRAGRSRQTWSPAGRYKHPLSRSLLIFCAIGFKLIQHILWCCHVIGQTWLITTFCAHRFFFYSIMAYDYSEGTTAGRVISRRSIMMHPGFRRKESMCARNQNIDYAKWYHTPTHRWLPAKMMNPSDSTKRFSWLTR